jgi:hypothetical protein
MQTQPTQGRSYLVTGLNLESRVAYVKPANLRYYTSVRDVTDIHVTGVCVMQEAVSVVLCAGVCCS